MLSFNSAGASKAQLDSKFLAHNFFSNIRKELSGLVSPLSYNFSEKVSMALSSGQNS